MKLAFRTTGPEPLSAAEQFLKSRGIKYRKRLNGSLYVPGDIKLSNSGLNRLPDLTSVSVGGDFNCSYNQLTSLEGAPQSVGGEFSCSNNLLTSLNGAPASVGGDFRCECNRLTSLEGGPRSVGGGFFCGLNRLVSLKGAPQSVCRLFSCAYNQLTSLEHAPQSVPDVFYCDHNQLTNLVGAPRKFRTLGTDFGDFKSWDQVPMDLKTSPEMKSRLTRSWEEMLIHKVTTLQVPLKVSSPLQLRR